jgi:hypothetical protein
VFGISDLDSTTIESWRTTGIVYLVGSYISIFPPTNLPVGWDITQALWQRILRKSDLAFLGKARLLVSPFQLDSPFPGCKLLVIPG